ncbi:hypothetical protein A3G53_02280 [Candidatus Nomurabacteria bacterium RIFCSPLOWO2_12_FULL_44_11]|uniref:Uncharacterized protein n=1 Tax=Candidatus Nomurabacteria bacterium RIFCSPLOWO2_12_FULL_44_11 TaxID=1801796 RepID=A0A1F6Y4U7_9BACT|nr:MAG: hypothetical protein A3E95_01550 [Candidatus Nomurabacteria bacterium RIFCSPHIGHO2_12_FULL_44_22b]OGJ01366.1 MAG: hypothetical protein A3G53_02280 [Candidatus Nomurabacteria bacterium RIFCSPLOWO2_12_FULL_44_11]
MWHHKSIEKFVTDRGLAPEIVQGIRERLDAVVDEDGLFSADLLDSTMDDSELARAFEQAFERDPSLRRAAFNQPAS